MLTPSILFLLLACSADDDPAENWLVGTIDLGDAVATGSGYDFDSPQAAWTAAEHVVPDLEWTWPASNVPLFLWTEVLMGENVSDEGTCPYVTADGSAETWRSDCRSQDGYDWEGTYTIDESDQDQWTTFDYEFDLEVASEVENRAFNRVDLNGRMSYVDGADAPLVRSSQSNLVMEVSGYWSRGFEDTLEQAWQKLAITGRWEGLVVDGTEQITLDAAVDLGELGGFRAWATLSNDDCLLEPKGEVTLVAEQTVTLLFHGDDACDGCAELTVDGERQANACRGL